jgi:hypothetical protein
MGRRRGAERLDNDIATDRGNRQILRLGFSLPTCAGGQGLSPLFPHQLSPLAAAFLCYAPDSFFFTRMYTAYACFLCYTSKGLAHAEAICGTAGSPSDCVHRPPMASTPRSNVRTKSTSDTLSTLHTSRNSSRSRRLVPNSYFETLVWGQSSATATSAWRNPSRSRVSRSNDRRISGFRLLARSRGPLGSMR